MVSLISYHMVFIQSFSYLAVQSHTMDQPHPPQRARPGRPPTRNREHVLRTALNAYWQDDRAALSVNAICALAGVSKPSLYRDFGSEDGLTDAVIERYAEEFLTELEGLLHSDLAFATKLQALVDFASSDSRLNAGCLFVKMRSTQTRFGPQTQARISAIEARLLAAYTRFFADAAQHGEWHSSIEPAMAGTYLHEQLSLSLSQRALGKPPQDVRPLLSLSLSALLQPLHDA